MPAGWSDENGNKVGSRGFGGGRPSWTTTREWDQLSLDVPFVSLICGVFFFTVAMVSYMRWRALVAAVRAFVAVATTPGRLAQFAAKQVKISQRFLCRRELRRRRVRGQLWADRPRPPSRLTS